MPAVIYFVSVVNDLGALMTARGADFLSVFDKPQRDAVAMVLLRLHSFQINASLVLAGAMISVTLAGERDEPFQHLPEVAPNSLAGIKALFGIASRLGLPMFLSGVPAPSNIS